MSEFLTRKLKTQFKQLDVNHDGYISLKELVEMAERHCDTEKADAVEREKITGTFAKVWRMWMKSTEQDDNGLLTPSIFVESIKQRKNDPQYKELVEFRAQRGEAAAGLHRRPLCDKTIRPSTSHSAGVWRERRYSSSLRLDMSEYLARKVRTQFQQMDVNDDGYISLKDFVEIAERHCDTEKADAVEREKVTDTFAKVWRMWMKSTECDDNGLLTPSIFVESVKQQKNDTEFKDTYRELCRQYIHILDVNGDGFLQEEEYARSFASAGFKDKGIIRRAFEAIDVNEDGKLSLEEFSTAMVEYLTSDDDKSRYTELWGPLVN